MVLRKSFYIRWSAGRSPRVHEVNPGRDPSYRLYKKLGTPCSGGYSLGSPNYLYRSLSSRSLRFLET